MNEMRFIAVNVVHEFLLHTYRSAYRHTPTQAEAVVGVGEVGMWVGECTMVEWAIWLVEEGDPRVEVTIAKLLVLPRLAASLPADVGDRGDVAISMSALVQVPVVNVREGKPEVGFVSMDGNCGPSPRVVSSKGGVA